MYDRTFDALLALLERLGAVRQAPRLHPEGDALFHSLQVFERAKAGGGDPELLAAALLHDVGKALAAEEHAAVGAELVGDLVSPRVAWLIEHHMDLLRAPGECRRRLAGDPRLPDLLALRAWDLAGRSPAALVPTVERALGELLSPGLAELWLSSATIREDGLPEA